MFTNVALLEKSVASKGEPRFVAKVLRQVSVGSCSLYTHTNRVSAQIWSEPACVPRHSGGMI